MNACLLFCSANILYFCTIQESKPGNSMSHFHAGSFYLNEGSQENYLQAYPCDLDTTWLSFFMMTLAYVKLTIKNNYHRVPALEGDNK